MKLAIIGYGRMGHEIEAAAIQRGHEVVITIDKDNMNDFESEKFKSADVAIEFTFPESAVSDYLKCFKAGIPVVSGTTGWLDKRPMVEDECKKNNCGFLYASNFSLGVNLFFELNRKLAKMMGQFSDYSVRMNEIHHTKKLDAPSGTAITLGEDIIKAIPSKDKWVNTAECKPNELSITSERIGDVPGTHEIFYKSEADEITIRHEAFNRKGFALGAVIAAEFMVGKKGIYSMSDVFNSILNI
ncbi:MAG: 4-hydroxy-tetrahydrodipicolinate reductase [Salinivirgaceae bacterium]|nr:4-hydroxy-tetrahydrodipicolinate reductase [Salinivirgaceae bacterium]